MREAGLSGDILPWRDVLHDGPVPRDLSLAELSRVRASFLAGGGAGEFHEIAQEFVARDALLERFPEFEQVVLWFEWDLYDQLQLIQILDTIAHRTATLDKTKLPPIETVSIAGCLGALPVENFQGLYQNRIPVTADMLALGRAAWVAFTSPDPTDILVLLEAGTDALPFLDGALRRHLEEFPSVENGLSRAEKQLLEAIAAGKSSFADAFRYAAEQEERVYLGDSSAASYLERLSRGDEPLAVYPSGERVHAPRTESESAKFRDAELVLTDAGHAVLAGKRDWIGMGGSDRWLGGVHLDGSSTRWRWDAQGRGVIETHGE
jgi:hypothetical protein